MSSTGYPEIGWPVQQRALGASVAALGLSNKAVYEDDVLNGPSLEPTGSVTTYTEVKLSSYWAGTG